MGIEIATLILLYAAFCGFAYKRSLTYMHIYQQEEYDSPRFLKWMLKNKIFDKRLSALIIAISIVAVFLPAILTNFLVFLAFTLIAYKEKDPRKDSKKKLVMTARVKRIFTPSLVLVAAIGLWCFLPTSNVPLIWLAVIHFIPFAIMLSNAALTPFENATQNKFWHEAHNKIMDFKPTVIAITGSYGKTSVKHILGHILKTQAKTLMTPGSVNTPMGIARIVREELEHDHKFFIVEMGAYGPGSIARLCSLTPPDQGILTAIGPAHYERFKSLDTVAQTKYELAESVLGRGGQMIVGEKTLRFENARTLRDQYKAQFVICGEQSKLSSEEPSYLEDGDLMILRNDQTAEGLDLKISWKGETYNIEAPLYGLHHGHNLAFAFACALELGVSAKDIQASLHSLPQIRHRLEVKKQAGMTIIDDAYNSNPLGFQSALGLLAKIGSTGRKILITPGMVELGDIHDDAHKTIGITAAQVCDVAIVVQGKRIPSFISSFKATAANKELIEVDSFEEAQTWIHNNRQDGDVVLLENDLPDLYERMPKI